MALGIPDKAKKGETTQLGIPSYPNDPKATIGGQMSTPPAYNPSMLNGLNIPELNNPFSGGPSLPPGTPAPGSTGVIFPDNTSGPKSVAFNGGQYNPTTAPFGFDQSTPGVLEQHWNNNQNLWFKDPSLDWVNSQLGQFEDPWAGEQAVSGMLGSIANSGAGQQYWNGIKGSFNEMGKDMQPQFDAYYDRMKQKVMSDVNSQSAARGAYGSNAALNGSIGAGLDVEAQRAKAATDFMMDNARFGLDKTRLGGELAFKAEDLDFDKKKTQAELAFGLDDRKAQRLGAGISTAFGSSDRHRQALNDSFEAAGKAQDAFENRTNNLYHNVEGFTSDVQNYITSNADKLLAMGQQGAEQQLQAMIAQAADERGWDQYTAERIYRDASETLKALTGKEEAGKK